MRSKSLVIIILCGLLLSITPDVFGKKPPRPKRPKTEKEETDFSFDGEALLFTEYMPRFRNGTIKKYQSWVQSQVVYPEAMKQQAITGIVTAEFVVNQEGLVRGIKILKTPHERLGQEVERVMKLPTGKWDPGYDEEGNPVDIRQTIAIRFPK